MLTAAGPAWPSSTAPCSRRPPACSTIGTCNRPCFAARLAAVRLQDEEETSWWSLVLPAAAGGALLALAAGLAPVRGWGCVALAGSTIAFALAQRVEAGARRLAGQRWLAEHKGLAW